MLTDELTERRLKELESQISEMYRTSSKELGDKAANYFKKFEKRDAEMRDKLDAGKITKDEYKQWRMTQIGRGKRWEALQSELSRRAVHADQIAADYINGVTPNLYAENYNYQAFTIEQAATRMTVNGFTSDVSFTVMNEDTVKRLMTGKNHIGFRTVRVNPKRDYSWNARRIRNELTAGIIQGESMGTIANRFYSVMGSNRKAAVRNARTAVTSAQNGGRMDAMRRAMEQGYPAKKQWVATMDERTRLSHILMGQEIVDAGKPFSNGLMYPGDPDGDPSEVYNCRCTMVDADDRFRTAQDDELDAMYQEWKADRLSDMEEKYSTNDGSRGIIKSDIYIGKSVGAAAKNYPIRLPNGNHARLAADTKITKIKVFAGKGTGVPIRAAGRLESEYGIKAEKWKKVRGDAYIIENHTRRHVEIHWYEAEDEMVEMKVKRFFDED